MLFSGILLGSLISTLTTAGAAGASAIGTASAIGASAVGASATALGTAKALTTAKTVSTVLKTVDTAAKAAKVAGTATKVTKTAGTALDVSSKIFMPTTVAAKKTTAEIVADVATAAADGSTKIIRNVPFVGDGIADFTNAVGKAAGDFAAKNGASKTTCKIVTGVTTTSGNVAAVDVAIEGAKTISEISQNQNTCEE